MSTESDSSLLPRCMICNAKSTGLHYGVASCEGCKAFFKRTTTGVPKRYRCYFGGDCDISPNTRLRCKACRYQRCLKTGMSLEGVKVGRMPNTQKATIVDTLKRKDYQAFNVEEQNEGIHKFGSYKSPARPFKVFDNGSKHIHTFSSHYGHDNNLGIESDYEHSKDPVEDGTYTAYSEYTPKTVRRASDTTLITNRMQNESDMFSPYGNIQLGEKDEETKIGHARHWPDESKTTNLVGCFSVPRPLGNPIQNITRSEFSSNATLLAASYTRQITNESAQHCVSCNDHGNVNLKQTSDGTDQRCYNEITDPFDGTHETSLHLDKLSYIPGKGNYSIQSVDLILNSDESTLPDNLISSDTSEFTNTNNISRTDDSSPIKGKTFSNIKQRRQSYSPAMIGALIDKVVETTGCNKIVHKIQKPDNPDNCIVENVISKLNKATLKQTYVYDTEPTVLDKVTTRVANRIHRNESVENSGIELDHDCTIFNTGAIDFHAYDKDHVNSGKQRIQHNGRINRSDFCEYRTDHLDVKVSELSPHCTRKGLCPEKHIVCDIATSLQSIRLGMAILFKEKDMHMETIRGYKSGKLQLKFTTDREEEIKETYQQLIESIPAINKRVIGFCNSIAGFVSLTTDDRDTLTKRAYYDIWMLAHSSYFQDGHSYLFLPSGDIYSTKAMRRILNDDCVDTFLAFAEQFNDLGLTDLEMAIFCAVRLTDAAHVELYQSASVKKLNDHLVDVFTHELSKNHPDNHNRLNTSVQKLIPLLEKINRIQGDIIANLPVDVDCVK